jgi:hypothetical protein
MDFVAAEQEPGNPVFEFSAAAYLGYRWDPKFDVVYEISEVVASTDHG